MLKIWEKFSSQLYLEIDKAHDFEPPDILIKLLIAAEDHRFQSHIGVDIYALCRATWRTFLNNRIEGGSTIAMQTVRVITSRYERTLSRKIIEIYLAIRLTKHIPRSEIPKIYLKIAYYGWSMNGLTQALQRLSINAQNISRKEAASIIARLKYPEPKEHNPKHQLKIKTRTNYIISRFDSLPSNLFET